MKRHLITWTPRWLESGRPRFPRHTTRSWRGLPSRGRPTWSSRLRPCWARTEERLMANVQMPRLSDSMETGKVLRWLKKEGEEVKKGEPLVEIESDKANIEVEAYASGKLSKIVVPEGESAPIGAVIAEIGGGGEAATPKTEKPAPTQEQ